MDAMAVIRGLPGLSAVPGRLAAAPLELALPGDRERQFDWAMITSNCLSCIGIGQCAPATMHP